MLHAVPLVQSTIGLVGVEVQSWVGSGLQLYPVVQVPPALGAARIALTGAKGLLAFVIGVIGYGGALAFFVAAMLKPFNPHIGLWMGSSGVVWGMKSDALGGRELLGPYFIYASIALSFVFASGCTLLLQRLTRPSKPVLSAVGRLNNC